jgi:hypothetical protein
MTNKICNLFDIQYPIIQAGMVWCSGWELASAVSNAGGLGLIGSGSMYPEVLLNIEPLTITNMYMWLKGAFRGIKRMFLKINICLNYSYSSCCIFINFPTNNFI